MTPHSSQSFLVVASKKPSTSGPLISIHAQVIHGVIHRVVSIDEVGNGDPFVGAIGAAW